MRRAGIPRRKIQLGQCCFECGAANGGTGALWTDQRLIEVACPDDRPVVLSAKLGDVGCLFREHTTKDVTDVSPGWMRYGA
jgi:hypothetical protein